MKPRVKLLCAFALALCSQGALAVTYPLPPEGSRLVGSTLNITVPQDNHLPLEAFAAQYGQGLSNMLEANPNVDVFLPKSGSTLVVPQQLILPDTVRRGIVVNVAEMRLYYYPPEGNTVEVLPIGIGQAGRETPRNWVTTVERKQEAPSWTPTPNTRREYAKRGESLPAFVPAGPDNPMGLYAIYIGRLYAIHGTNANFGIGLRVSQGCIRLRNDDIKYLFDNVPVGTRVQIIDQPVKYTVEPDGSRWVEVHEPLSRNRTEYESDNKVPLPITPALRSFTQGEGVDGSRARGALERRSGMPVNISTSHNAL
ncbi:MULTISPECIES: L,D-transpeptidase [Kluyvera]|uniref:L,D-transpeptidase n=1 Tax=Kluyvera sichuanensis TaxID=2725494 RepID=A0ABR6S163_9ENTR|nr:MULTISPECIES: L,D-transpeptidase [Kluyvera]MBC1189099.1 L,D-transpeptidase [Kluyvera sichuanensis]MBW9461073.1 L,D-transpeptidase [Kluyvera sp. EC_51]